MKEVKREYQRKERTDIIYGLHAVIEAIKTDKELNKILRTEKELSFTDLKYYS